MSKNRLAKTLTELDAKSRLEQDEATIRDLTRQLKRLHREHGKALEFNDAILAAVSRMPAPKICGPLKLPAHGANVAAVFNLGDWHIGERISEEEMDGFNKYDFTIAKSRMDTLLSKSLEWIELQRKGYQIRRAYVNLLGDLINGDIHPESYWRTEEFPVPDQISHAGHMLARVIGSVAAQFDEVVVNCIGADNHGRRTKKPATKTAAMNNYNYNIYDLARTSLERFTNIHMIYHKPLKAEVKIEGREVLISHGHETKSWMGIPFYGIERSQGREARKRLSVGRTFTLQICGHYHTSCIMPTLLMNGSLCGSTEFDAMAGRYSEASQTTFLMHKDHGPFAFIPWNLQEARGSARKPQANARKRTKAQDRWFNETVRQIQEAGK